jgi:hypothetical protein
VPLSAAACLTLARLVLAGAEPAERAAMGDAAGLARAFVRFGGRDDGVVAWLAGIDAERASTPPAERSLRVAPESVMPSENHHERLVRLLSEALVVEGPGATPGARRTVTAEAAVLVDAVTAARARGLLARDFDAAVAAARIEAMREFAYGAGHELNNPLANIATRAQALLLDETDPERRRRLAVIVDQAFRGRDMIGGLMLFARPPKPTRGRGPIDTLLMPVIEGLQSLAAARGARLQYSPPPTPLEVCVDVAQVAEAIRLIGVNAFEAAARGGRVAFEAAAASRGDRDGCLVTIVDDGPGMDVEVLRRSFDPFYSGREAGRGIGLGLPKAWRLLDANGGELFVASRPGKGTRVEVLLPMIEDGAR